MLTYKSQQSRPQGASGPYAANAVPSVNLGKVVVVVAAVPGSKTVEVLVTQDFSTRGTRAYTPAKHGHDGPG